MSCQPWSFQTPADLVGEAARRAFMLIHERPAPVQPKLLSVVETFIRGSLRCIRPSNVTWPEFERTYDEHYARRYGPWRSIINIGAFAPDGTFLCLPRIDEQRLLDVWQDKVYELFVKEGKIDPETVDQLRCWPHSGFSVDNSVYTNVAKHVAKVAKTFDANVGISPRRASDRRRFGDLSSGKGSLPPLSRPGQQRLARRTEAQLPSLQRLGLLGRSTILKRASTWFAGTDRRLVAVYEVDPLECPCGGQMKIVSFIERRQADARPLFFTGNTGSTRGAR